MAAKVRMQITERASIEVEAGTVKDAFKELANYAEVFCETTCGSCGSQDVRPVTRTAKGYDFFEMHCLACKSRLGFGKTKEGGLLFLQRFSEHGDPIGKNGWHHYEGPQRSQTSDAGF